MRRRTAKRRLAPAAVGRAIEQEVVGFRRPPVSVGIRVAAAASRNRAGLLRKKTAGGCAGSEKIAIFVPQRFPEARRKAPTEGIKWESGVNPEQFPLLYVPAPPLRGECARHSLATDFSGREGVADGTSQKTCRCG